MHCPKCQFENREGVKFCEECGAKFELECPACRANIPFGRKFCGECGHNLNLPSEPALKELSFDEKLDKIQRYLPKGLTEKILSQRDKIEGERKQVTVMFCDMEGFTSMTEKLGPEEAYSLMDQVYEVLIHKVHDYEGTINEMTGDGIMALFGAPIALEDGPQRAIRSAYAIHHEITRFSAKIRQEKKAIPPIQMRIGIHTGPVVVGTLGNDLRVEFKAVGDTVNLASRIEGIAEPGSTLVTEDTFKPTEGLFLFEALDAQYVKGKQTPVKVYRVIAPSTWQTRFDVNASRGLTPIVGRQRELELLLDGFERAKGGLGQAFSIVADAGVGKSRLLYEFRKSVANEDATILEGNCLSYSKNLAYYPLIDILKSDFNILQSDKDFDIQEKVKNGLKKLGGDETQILPYLLNLLSVQDSGIKDIPLSPEVRKVRTFEALKHIALKGSQIRPLIMVIENLHWIDKTSEEALKYLLDSISGAPILLIFTYRPEFMHTWGAKSYHNQVNLNRLSNRESLTMVTHILGTENINVDLEEYILMKTEGIPFFIEEFVKSLKDLQIIEKVRDSYRLVKDLKTLIISSTIQEVIMARVDSLSDGAKSLIQTGSVAGREFSYDLIKIVTGVPEKQLLRRLAVLKDSELVYERGIHPETTYVFKHALTQEAVYQSLIKGTRQRYHREIAQVLQEHFSKIVDAQPELLGYHFAEAGLLEQAIPHIQRAGERAIQRFAHVEAIAHFTKGLKLIKALPDSHTRNRQELVLYMALGQAYVIIKGFAAPEIEHVYTRARELCQQVGSRSDLFSVLQGMWVFYQSQAQHQKAREIGEELLRLAKLQNNLSLLMQAHCTLGACFYYLGEFSKALEHLETGMVHYESRRDSPHPFLIGRSDPKIFFNIFAARIFWLCGYPDKALQKSFEMLELAKKLSHPYSIIEALVGIVRVLQCRREGQRAQKHAEALLELSTEHGFSMRAAQGTFLKGWAIAAQGQQKKGVKEMIRGLDAWRATGLETHVPDFLAFIAEIYGKQGQIEEGLEMLDEALYLVQNTKECWWEAELYRIKGELLLMQGKDETEAEDSFKKGIEISKHQRAKSLELRSTLSLIRLWQAQGKRKDAKRELTEIYNWFKEGFDTADLKEARELLEVIS